MGFGHRVYKNYDPRAKIVKQQADDILKKLGVTDPLLDIAKQLEEMALADDYFIERKLYPNVDFYTGVIYRAMGFPTKMFTVLFALGRLPGWIAHWREMINDPATKIGRPRQLYTGSAGARLRPDVRALTDPPSAAAPNRTSEPNGRFPGSETQVPCARSSCGSVPGRGEGGSWADMARAASVPGISRKAMSRACAAGPRSPSSRCACRAARCSALVRGRRTAS